MNKKGYLNNTKKIKTLLGLRMLTGAFLEQSNMLNVASAIML